MDFAPEWRRRTGGRCLHVVVPRAAGSSPSVMSPGTDNPRYRYTLPRSSVIRGHGSFRSIISKRHIVRQQDLTCFYDVSTIPPFSCRVGFVVKDAPTAVVRNHGKRILRECFRLQQGQLQDSCSQNKIGLQCIFMLYSGKKAPKPEFHTQFINVGICLSKIINDLGHSFEHPSPLDSLPSESV